MQHSRLPYGVSQVVLLWVSARFSGFLPPPKKVSLGGLATLKCVCVGRGGFLGVFPPHAWFSQDSLWIHYDPDWDKAFTEHQVNVCSF